MKNVVSALRNVALGLIGLLGLGLFAGVTDVQAQVFFDRTDRDRDGRVSREEYRHRMVEVFFAADRNRDGVVVPAELIDVRPEAFVAADEDRDGKLTLAEFLRYRERDFDLADRNRNRALEPEESARPPGLSR